MSLSDILLLAVLVPVGVGLVLADIRSLERALSDRVNEEGEA